MAHRAIRTICEVAGIRDLYAKVEGRINLQKVVKAFLAGLEKQETHQELAERKRIHVVELKKENQNFPLVLASPTSKAVRRDPSENDPDEILRFNEMYFEGKVRLIKPKKPPFYHKLPSWQLKLRQMDRRRGWDKIRLNCWLKQELAPSHFYDNLFPPDVRHPREPITLAKSPAARSDQIGIPLKRIV